MARLNESSNSFQVYVGKHAKIRSCTNLWEGPFIRLKGNFPHKIYMWDTDSYPTTVSYPGIRHFTTYPFQIRTMDLSKLTGLTIFSKELNGTMGIYGHNSNDSAVMAFQNLHERINDMWRYFPLQHGERIINVWVKIAIPGDPVLAVPTSGRHHKDYELIIYS